MNKDVIYIDVDDDITAIIGKVKASDEKIVVLIPPKRIGVLQSAVNLRLLQKTATTQKKRLVLITSNPALTALAASAKMYVAKNAQTKPEIPKLPKHDDEPSDTIDGGNLPVGDHDSIGRETETDKAAASIISDNPAVDIPRKKPVATKGVKVPNFNTFRKKLVIGSIVGALLISGLTWAIFFAPRATVIITAKTNEANISNTVRLVSGGSAATSFTDGAILAVRQEQVKSRSIEFTPTGQKDAGEKATGTVRFSTNDAAFIAGGGLIPAGTRLTSSSGLVFVTSDAVTLSLFNLSGNTPVSAAENGTKYNAASGSLSGAPSGVSATFTGPTGGGVTKMVTIVTAEDVHKASAKLAEEGNGDDVKKALVASFGSNTKVIEDSFASVAADPASSPKVGEEADKAQLTSQVTYSMYGIANSEIDSFLDEAVKETIADQDDQKMYKNGRDNVTLTDFVSRDKQSTVSLAATGRVGPSIKDSEIKELVAGKRLGDIQVDIESIQGVDGVDVKFFPFWVRTVPGNLDRITIEFKVDGEK